MMIKRPCTTRCTHWAARDYASSGFCKANARLSTEVRRPNFPYLYAKNQAFRHFDARRKAKVSEADLSDGLRRLGLELTTQQERALFKAMGKTHRQADRQTDRGGSLSPRQEYSPDFLSQEDVFLAVSIKQKLLIPDGAATADVGQTSPALRSGFRKQQENPAKSAAKPLLLPISRSRLLSLCVCVVRWADLDNRGYLVYADLVVFARDPNHHDVRHKILRQ